MSEINKKMHPSDKGKIFGCLHETNETALYCVGMQGAEDKLNTSINLSFFPCVFSYFFQF